VKTTLSSALVAVVFLAAALPAAAGAAPLKYLEHRSPPGAPALPFSDAVIDGNTLYVAGHLGIDPQTGVAPADPAVEARMMMDAVKSTVEAAGFTMDQLVSVTVYCSDLALYDQFNAVYRSYFHGHYPARAFIGAAKLLRGARFEAQGIAVKAQAR